ncbi:MAG: flagellar hook-basal body complex protein [Deltaproteobacteria bacterium]|jgi:flagellar hook-basal body protein
MSISSSLYSSISSLNAMVDAMSVLGDNVANVNTVGFKSSRATFQDVLSQSVSTAAGTAQVGRGVTLSTVDGIFAQGSFESTTNPTDMAIGGQGFFMLRAADSPEADMYSRAGEFRFDQDGYLINPSGYYVQGWSIDSDTGETQGTIGDIYLGKSTPPVPTDRIQAIVNLDSRVPNEVNPTTLYDAWSGTNAADPIDSSNYEYTSATKIYDSQGAGHDITTYFDRTGNDNEWEFLVTCDPTEDLRSLSGSDLTTCAPDETYNYQGQKGAGALMYGIINFNTSGDISKITAYNVPPDGEVDPSLNTNRITLDSTDKYYSFETNFTGDTENQDIELNLGAAYSGLPTTQKQILVSDKGALDSSSLATPITGETLWGSVYDSTGKVMTEGDVLDFAGYQNDGTQVSGQYTVSGSEKVQNLLDALGSNFNATATIDGEGRLRLTDNDGGDSGMYVTSFTTSSATGADPFGSQIDITTSKQEVVSPDHALSSNTGLPLTADTSWNSVFDSSGSAQVANGDVITFSGTKGGGTAVGPVTYTANTTDGSTVQDLLDTIETAFNVDASIDGAGQLVLRDRVADTANSTSQLSFRIESYGASGAQVFGPTATNFDTIQADLAGDGSQQGEVVSTGFDPEALASTQYANASTTLYQDQNGCASGFLQSVSVDTDGVITGHYSNGQVLEKAQVALATFNNMGGLQKESGNIFTQTTQSGAPVTGAPGTIGLGSIAPNSLEQSNVDLGAEFVKLITTQRGFQANSKIITTTDEMLVDLINIKR